MIEILPWQDGALRELLARRQRLPHALLVHGRGGIGKTAFARALAQSLLCETPQDGIACGECAACGWFREGNHPDFRELLPDAMSDDEADGETPADAEAREKKKSREIRIDQVRDIASFMTLSTHRDGLRILLIHPAEAMNAAAANALLKTLEEPPPRSLILMVTSRFGRLLATIRSRCQRVLLPTPDADRALTWLRGQGVDDAEAALAAAGGAPFDALAQAEPTYRQARRGFVAALADPALDFVAVAQAHERAELAELLGWLQTWVGDVILQRMAGRVAVHGDQAATIRKLAARADLARLFRYESHLRATRRLINHPLNARLLLEELLIGYAEAVR